MSRVNRLGLHLRIATKRPPHVLGRGGARIDRGRLRADEGYPKEVWGSQGRASKVAMCSYVGGAFSASLVVAL